MQHYYKQKLSAFCFHHFLSRLHPIPPEHHSFLLIVYFFVLYSLFKLGYTIISLLFFSPQNGHIKTQASLF